MECITKLHAYGFIHSICRLVCVYIPTRLPLPGVNAHMKGTHLSKNCFQVLIYVQTYIHSYIIRMHARRWSCGRPVLDAVPSPHCCFSLHTLTGETGTSGGALIHTSKLTSHTDIQLTEGEGETHPPTSVKRASIKTKERVDSDHYGSRIQVHKFPSSRNEAGGKGGRDRSARIQQSPCD